MEKELSDYPFLVRCHRAFIVNVYQVEEINDYKFRLKFIETEVPISKSYNKTVLRRMKLVDD
jgi:DNA-binding LytR/AlgR family response regulator